MDERTLTILLRLIHILAGVFWVGAIFLLAGFLMPTARSVGPESDRFMQHLMVRRRLPIFLGVAMLLTVISGLTMYVRMTGATHGTWASTPPGIGYGVGGLAAILGAILGGAISGPAARRLGVIGQQAAQSGGPSVEQQSEMQRLQARATLGSRLTAGLLALAAGAMAIARYL
jgi:uncharacterized membrane protein